MTEEIDIHRGDRHSPMTAATSRARWCSSGASRRRPASRRRMITSMCRPMRRLILNRMFDLEQADRR